MKIQYKSNLIEPISENSKAIIEEFFLGLGATDQIVIIDKTEDSYLVEFTTAQSRIAYKNAEGYRLSINDLNFICAYDFWVLDIIIQQFSIIISFNDCQYK